jgi:hypothetical protein
VRVNGGGTSSIQQLLQPLGYEDELLKSPRTTGALVRMLNQALSGGQALLAVDIDWEASFYDKEKDKTVYQKRGMRNFPKDASGNAIPSLDWAGNDEYGGESLLARAYIKRFYPANSVGGGEKLTADLEASVQQAQQPKAAAPANKPVAAMPQARPQSPQAPQPRHVAAATVVAGASSAAGGPPVPHRATVTAGAAGVKK